MRVALEAGRLTINAAQGYRGTLEHSHYDTLRTRWDGLPQEGHTYATFALVDAAGRPAQLTLDFDVPPITSGRVDSPR